MTNSTFNVLEYNKKLKAAGVPEQQADLQAEAIYELMEKKLDTKEDLKNFPTKFDLQQELQKFITKEEIRFLFGATITILSLVMAALKLLH